MSEDAVYKQISELEQTIIAQKKKLAELRLTAPRREVAQYTFHSGDGKPVTLSELFGDKQELIVVHNMGKSCPYCTLWADGFNGLYFHLENKAGFVVSTPDAPEVMKEFAESRGWKFKTVSTKGTSFKRDFGFEKENEDYWPGVSTFVKDEHGKITHVADSVFGPGDDFCSAWFFFDLLPSGGENWHPKFKY
jgi:predicted dithiol-disulfide oxidoreductase (DUF899 family)